MSVLPWYIAGPLIGLMVPLLLYFKEKQLGLSSSYRFLGSFVLPKNSYFNYQKSNDAWQFHFALGIILAAFALVQLDLFTPQPVDQSLTYNARIPDVYSIQHWMMFLVGGVFIGFGARYADGCTAGHCIMGSALLSKASIISTVMFFVGGLIISHFFLPFIV